MLISLVVRKFLTTYFLCTPQVLDNSYIFGYDSTLRTFTVHTKPGDRAATLQI